MTITFGAKRNSIRATHWAMPRQKSREAKVIGSVGSPPDPGPYRPLAGKLRRPTSIVVRGPQARFRINVRAAYGDRCAISGCDISEALEAIHIDPYENASQHHPCNGLLLRKDLHALFDENLIAVDPSSRLVHVAPNVRRYPEYRRLHKKCTLRGPVPGYEEYVPADSALQRRWNRRKEVAES